MVDNQILELGYELHELYKILEFPCSDEEDIGVRARIAEIEMILSISKTTTD